MTHIVWDWNGTLLHDTNAVVAASNAALAGLGLEPVTVEAYRAVYSRPVWRAYELLLGRALRPGEWEQLDQAFHESYLRATMACDLTEDARASLTAWQRAGRTQSLLSMWLHDPLVEAVRRFGIDGYFNRVDGLRASGGGPKATHLVAHLEALSLEPGEVIMIGDSLDDAAAAEAVGAGVILYTGGTTARSVLLATGAPVVDTLAEAMARAQAST